jgi:zinc/manganese transport system substrate-binding protein
MHVRTTLGAVLCAALLAACGSGSAAPSDGAAASGSCPATPVRVVVSVNQWGDIASALGGACAQVDTIIADSKIDPHDYEPTPGDIAAFQGTGLVVLNGAGYDAWAGKAVDAASPRPSVVDASVVSSVADGGNPHVWYRPDAVMATAAAITAALSRLAPQASSYFATRHAAWLSAMKPYLDEVAHLKAAMRGQTYGATESVFDYLAAAVGLVDRTPAGYRQAIANGSDPSPGDLYAFLTALHDKEMTVLVYNTQTSSAVTDQLRDAAGAAGVPVVEITETVPSGVSFPDWQLGQLEALASALGVS